MLSVSRVLIMVAQNMRNVLSSAGIPLQISEEPADDMKNLGSEICEVRPVARVIQVVSNIIKSNQSGCHYVICDAGIRSY